EPLLSGLTCLDLLHLLPTALERVHSRLPRTGAGLRDPDFCPALLAAIRLAHLHPHLFPSSRLQREDTRAFSPVNGVPTTQAYPPTDLSCRCAASAESRQAGWLALCGSGRRLLL